MTQLYEQIRNFLAYNKGSTTEHSQIYDCGIMFFLELTKSLFVTKLYRHILLNLQSLNDFFSMNYGTWRHFELILTNSNNYTGQYLYFWTKWTKTSIVYWWANVNKLAMAFIKLSITWKNTLLSQWVDVIRYVALKKD